jgi:hypothetical protein
MRLFYLFFKNTVFYSYLRFGIVTLDRALSPKLQCFCNFIYLIAVLIGDW